MIILQVARAARTPSESGQLRLVWRLLAANNRAVGQSHITYSTLESAVAAVAVVRHAEEQLSVRLERISPTPAWRWVAWAEEQLLAVGSHHYHRRVECARGFTLFRDCLRSAELDLSDWGVTGSAVADARPAGSMTGLQ